MSYESISNLVDDCNHEKERYQGYYSSSLVTFKNNLSSWHDDVGAEANKSFRTISDTWYRLVTDGFGNASSGAQSVKKAYSKLKAVKQKVEHAVNKINCAMAGLK